MADIVNNGSSSSPNPVISGAVQAGGNLLSGIWNEIFFNRHLRKQQEANKDMMAFQHEMNIEDWNRQNEYNLPVNQYQRYIDAGMTPAAAMQAVSGQQAQSQAVSATQQGSVTATPGTLSMQGLEGVMLDARRVKMENELKQAEADYYKSMSYRNYTLTPKEAAKLEADTIAQFDTLKNNEALRDKFKAETNRINLLSEAERDKLVEETNLIVEKITETKEAVKNLGKQRELYDSEIRRNDAAAVESYASAEEHEAGAGLKRELTYTQEYETYIKMVEANKAEIQRYLIQNYHINPDDEFWKQVIESGAKGDDYGTDFIQALGNYAAGVDGVLENNFPGYKKKVGAIGGLILASKLHDVFLDKSHKTIRNLKDLEDAVLPFMGKGTANPIGFIK